MSRRATSLVSPSPNQVINQLNLINWNEQASYIACQRFPDFSKVVGEPAVIADANHSGLRVVRVQQSGVSHRWLTLDEVPKALDAVFEKPKLETEKPKMTLAQVMGLAMPSKPPKRSTLTDFRPLVRQGSVKESGSQKAMEAAAAAARAVVAEGEASVAAEGAEAGDAAAAPTDDLLLRQALQAQRVRSSPN